MRKFLLLIAVLLLIDQSSKAQYSLAFKGQLCPFDTAVTIDISTYRLESLKFRYSDSLIFGLQFQIGLLESKVNFLTELNRGNLKKIELFSEYNRVSLKTIDLLNDNFKKQKKTFWQKHKFWIGFSVGLVTGSVILSRL